MAGNTARTWQASNVNGWELQINQGVADRVYTMLTIQSTSTTKTKVYHATVFLDNIEYCEKSTHDRIVIDNQALEAAREMIHNFNNLW